MRTGRWYGTTLGSISLLLSSCLLLATLFAGCGQQVDPYQEVLRLQQAKQQLYFDLEESIGFTKSLETFDIKNNEEVFKDLIPSLDRSASACEKARNDLEEIYGIERESTLSGLEGPIEKLGDGVEGFLARAEEIIAYLYGLDLALQPLKDLSAEIQGLSETTVDLEYAIAPEIFNRIDNLLSTQDEVITSLNAPNVPASVSDLHSGLISSIVYYYEQAAAIRVILQNPEEVSIGFEEGSVNEGSEYFIALEKLEGKLDLTSLEEATRPFDDLIFEYLVEYRPEAEE